MDPNQENEELTQAESTALSLQSNNFPEGGELSQPVPGMPVQTRQKGPIRKRFVIGVGMLVLFLVFIGFLVFRLLGDLKLTIYDAQTYRLQVPKGYKYQPSGSRVRFVEEGGDPSTRSFVVVHIVPHQEVLSDATKQQLIQRYEEQIPQLIGQSSDANEKIENIQTQHIIHREKDAFRVTADIIKQDKRARLDMLVVIGDMAVFMVGVAAHSEDTLLSSASNRIVTSLVLYEF
jgi:hypothetical protein